MLFLRMCHCAVIHVIVFVKCSTLGRGLVMAELHPAADFSHHTLIKPRIYHGREKRQISTTKEEGGGHTYHLAVDYTAYGKKHILDLQLNKDLIPKGYFNKYQKNGKEVVNRPSLEEVDLCHYHGKIRGTPNSWAAISTCRNGLSGVVYDGQEMHYIEKASDNESTGFEDVHYLYKHSDLHQHNKTCGYSGDAGNSLDDEHDHEGHQLNRILRYKRSATPAIRGPYNANKQSRYVELVIVADNREFKELGESTSRVEKHCKDIANIINALYAPLNIFIALVGVVIWTEYDEVHFSENGDTTLTNFLNYRREKLIKNHPNDNAQLLTKFTFDNGVVGKALKGPICTYEYSGGVNTDHSNVLGLVATTVAHEMGHNFGMEHDTTDCSCADDRCIMAPSSSNYPPTHWSSCSLESLALAFEHGMDYCLRNKPESLFGSPLCGNGFVEPGEQCDCGLPEHCNDNTCCNASTCMLHSNASCATGECCDLKTCHPKNAGTLCRSADYECDLPEYCTGQSEYCPTDIYKMDTELCDGGKAYCFHGFCRTRTDQCKLLWGNTGKSSHELCYKMNTKGSRHGNCGYNKLNQSYFKCQDENVLCGMLHCRHFNEKLEFGMESVSILSHSFINLKGSIIPCRTALVDLGVNQVDPGLAPDGAKCGEGKMCVNQKCMAVANLRRDVPMCPHDCNGNGVCNSMGHCHCKDNFAPPYCDYPGPGGSEDSGPASDPNARKDFITAMFIIFLGVIPVLAIIAFLTYYTRHNMKFSWPKAPAVAKSPPKARGTASFAQETTKRTEDNHSLLAEENRGPQGVQNEFFGHFRGFTLAPIKSKDGEVARPAPPVPNAPIVPNGVIKSPVVTRSVTNVGNVNVVKPIVRSHTSKPVTLASAISAANNISVAPALPPLNPGSNARPIISSPILENSTCTAKELLSPLRNAPKVPLRAAPEAPSTNVHSKRPLSSPDATDSITFTEEIKKPKESMSAINRIASFLKSSDKKPQINTNSLPRNAQHKVNKILDKNSLRSIEISKPIPQSTIDVAKSALPVDSAETKNVVMRAQSMRGTNVTAKPHIQTFGSMRQPNGAKRPVSIPSGTRPKSPPPPRPPPVSEKPPEVKVVFKMPNLPGYQPPSTKTKQNQYDDCLNEAIKDKSTPSSDNIYAVIEESPISSPEAKPVVTTSSGSSESVGLLGEIVSEIQNRNLESIYSTNSLGRKKKELAEKKAAAAVAAAAAAAVASADSETYVNTSGIYKSPESVYSNMSNLKSSASSTSSGYITPAAVNPPIKKVESSKPDAAEAKLTTFKIDKKETAYKPYHSTLNRPQGPLASTYKQTTNTTQKPASDAGNNKATTPPSPTSKAPLSRQITPPNLRTRKPSPTRTATTPKSTQKPKPSNSPDLVTSCANSKATTTKPPDVLNVRKPLSVPTKPVPPKTVPKLSKSASAKSPVDKKTDGKPPVSAKLTKTNSEAGASKGIPAGARLAAKQSSNVAALQQKFENKPPISAKTVKK